MAKAVPSPHKERLLLDILAFSVKFLVGVVLLVSLWWKLLLPYYGWMLAKVCGFLAGLLGTQVLESHFQAQGMFNTESLIHFNVPGHSLDMYVCLLVTNLPPFAALVLATSGLTLWHRVRVLLVGCAILIAGHIAYVSLMLRFRETLEAHREVPTALIQLFLTLPFLLWIILAYWDHIRELLAESGDENKSSPR